MFCRYSSLFCYSFDEQTSLLSFTVTCALKTFYMIDVITFHYRGVFLSSKNRRHVLTPIFEKHVSPILEDGYVESMITTM